MSSATSRSDQHDHARLRLVTRFLPVSRILPRGPAAAHSPPAEFRRCTPPLTSAPSVGSSADAPGPLLRDPPLEPDAGGQADEGVEVVEAVAESDFLKARDGQAGLTVGDGVSQLFVYPARARSSGEFTQAVIHLTDVRAAVKELRVAAFEEYDTPETRTENGIARTPGGGDAAWFKDSEAT